MKKLLSLLAITNIFSLPLNLISCVAPHDIKHKHQYSLDELFGENPEMLNSTFITITAEEANDENGMLNYKEIFHIATKKIMSDFLKPYSDDLDIKLNKYGTKLFKSWIDVMFYSGELKKAFAMGITDFNEETFYEQWVDNKLQLLTRKNNDLNTEEEKEELTFTIDFSLEMQEKLEQWGQSLEKDLNSLEYISYLNYTEYFTKISYGKDTIYNGVNPQFPESTGQTSIEVKVKTLYWYIQN